MSDNKKTLPKISIMTVVIVSMSLAVIIPAFRGEILDTCSLLFKDMPFFEISINLIDALIYGTTEFILDISVNDICIDIVKSLFIIIIFDFVLDKIVNLFVEGFVAKTLTKFVCFFVCGILLSKLLEEFVAMILSDMSMVWFATAGIVGTILIICAVLIHWTHNSSIAASIFYVIFKTVFNLLYLVMMTLIGSTFYISALHNNYVFLIITIVIIILFICFKIVERLFVGQER